ncbi:MAG: Bifunctional chorismate mutase/prephenate dehydratase [Chroococcidiopsis sp. SAG 2025]|uniref:prephenate dehydratase n=1 Tax=Chroococcidiopsis sp. SAG 2025 TaxID=171389 RepID=UPI0029374905|nr:prephenate dehydratase [Chroococcidiopsis sp. SAG 2025]MDV2995233.1 Bifunctional chorismate mutase/prephenate dehydratase [Chroococcidiopsis sp. SAG 2025]
MTVSIAHLGPSGTYSEQAAIAYRERLQQEGQETALHPYPSIPQTLKAVAQGEAQIAVVPVENSIEGSVAVTLDMMWLLDSLQIQLALVLPIAHVLLSHAQSLDTLQVVYSHPQALAQCQLWFTQFLPDVKLIPTNSTTEALQHLEREKTAGAISSLRAAKLYNLPVLASGISDYPDNCTRFWVLSRQSSTVGSHTSLAFSLPANVPGALVKPLQVFAQRNINLSRIESRPTKRSLGEYLYFIDLEGDSHNSAVESALTELVAHTEILKNFGSYKVVLLNQDNYAG